MNLGNCDSSNKLWLIKPDTAQYLNSVDNVSMGVTSIWQTCHALAIMFSDFINMFCLWKQLAIMKIHAHIYKKQC